MSGSDFDLRGANEAAPFTLRAWRGDGMVLLAMNWKRGRPPKNFVGFAIRYRAPKVPGDTSAPATWSYVRNRLRFADQGRPPKSGVPSNLAPIQKFRWVHFPFNASRRGLFTYEVIPVFCDEHHVLSEGPSQTVKVELSAETHRGVVNVGYTRGMVASQAFVSNFGGDNPAAALKLLLPRKADEGLEFTAKPKATADQALPWMGFEARAQVLKVLDDAIGDPKATVKVVAYDLSNGEVLRKLKSLGKRLQIVIDDSKDHGHEDSAESRAAKALRRTAGTANVRRQHLGALQHNKTIIVASPRAAGNKVLCGSTNYTWRGFYVQNNNAVVLTGRGAVAAFTVAFDAYWASDDVATFGTSPAASWQPLGLRGVDASVTFSPHSKDNAVLASLAADIESASSSVFYSLAFLAQVGERAPVRKAIKVVTEDPNRFVYGMTDDPMKGIVVTLEGNPSPVSPESLTDSPPPFADEPKLAKVGANMHHKFVVIDVHLPTARVYTGSYNFSDAADRTNGENLLCIRDRKVAVSFMVEAVRMFDHYQYRSLKDDKARSRPLAIKRPPGPDEDPWWLKDYTEPRKKRDRLFFA